MDVALDKEILLVKSVSKFAHKLSHQIKNLVAHDFLPGQVDVGFAEGGRQFKCLFSDYLECLLEGGDVDV